jgi:hypothetical protein
MCLILDTDIVHQIFPTPTPDYQPIHGAITTRNARIVYGGRLLREYEQMNQFLKILYKLDQQGSARKIPDNTVDQEELTLANSDLCRSNDHHVIALSRISGARLLCTEDNNLIKDFTNPLLISNPRGKVYRRAAHAKLIQTQCRQLRPGKSKNRRKPK